RFGRGDRLHRIELGGLTEPETSELIQSVLGQMEIEPKLLEAIYRHTHGNPFSVLEYLRNVTTAGAVFPKWGKWVTDWERLETLDLPANVIELVGQRISRLTPPTLKYLKVAAACGPVFSDDLCRKASGI